eukprot:SAG31_NODE_1160_length_9602_cov_20.626434_9_plen_170_part_00
MPCERRNRLRVALRQVITHCNGSIQCLSHMTLPRSQVQYVPRLGGECFDSNLLMHAIVFRTAKALGITRRALITSRRIKANACRSMASRALGLMTRRVPSIAQKVRTRVGTRCRSRSEWSTVRAKTACTNGLEGKVPAHAKRCLTTARSHVRALSLRSAAHTERRTDSD